MCDLRLATSEATFGQPQVRRAIPAAYELLATVVGDASARNLCLTGRIINSAEALRIGLLHQVVQSEGLVEKSSLVAAEIAGVPTSLSMKQTFLEHQRELFTYLPPDHE